MKKHIGKIIKIIITIGILVFVILNFNIELDKIFYSIKDFKYLVIDFIIPILIMPFISANRWKLFLKQVGINEHLFSLIKINLKSIFLGLILPSTQGQDVLRIYYIEKRHP